MLLPGRNFYPAETYIIFTPRSICAVWGESAQGNNQLYYYKHDIPKTITVSNSKFVKSNLMWCLSDKNFCLISVELHCHYWVFSSLKLYLFVCLFVWSCNDVSVCWRWFKTSSASAGQQKFHGWPLPYLYPLCVQTINSLPSPPKTEINYFDPYT